MSLAHFFLRRAKVIVFAVVVLAAFGVRSYLIAPQSIFPQMSFARIDVVVDAGDLPPERVRIAVTRPLESAFGTLPQATRVRANSTQGSADIVVDFATSTDPRVDLQYVQAAIASLASTLPAAKTIDAVIVNPNEEPVLSIGLTSRVLSQAALQQFIEARIVPAFAGTPGLGRTTVVGGPPIEYRVDLAPASLAAVGLSAADVTAAIADAASVQSVGTADHYGQHYVVLIDAAIHDARSLARIDIPLKGGGTIPLGALGRVRYGVGPEVVQAAVDGTHAVILNAFPLVGADAVSLAREFSARFDRVRSALPAEVNVIRYWDQTRLIVDSQTSLRDAILLGALLAIIVIFLFLRSVRMTLVAAAIIPLAMAIAILVLERTGQSLNLMSVGGLAIAVGLIIDDTIVIIEGIARAVAEHPDESRPSVIAHAVGRLAGPMTASTATTVVVFIPLSLLSGVSGFFFRALAFTLATSLIVSLVLAIVVAPILANALLRGDAEHGERHDALNMRYQPILRWALSHRGAVFAGAAVVLATTVLLLVKLPSDFLPSLDEGEFEIKYTVPFGATVAASDAAAHVMETIVRKDPDVVHVGRLTGVDTNGLTPTQPSTGTLRISLSTGKRASYDAISSRLRDAIGAAVPSASLDFHQLLEDQINDLSGAPQPIEIRLSGTDQVALNATADAMSDAISKVPGVVDAFDGVTYDDPVLQVTPRAARLGALGLTSGDVGDALGARTQGAIATQLPGAFATIPVRVRVGDAPLSTDGIAGAAVVTREGTAAAQSLARVTRAPRASDVNEENGRRVVLVTANIEDRSLSAVVADLRPAIARVPLPAGISVDIGGAYQTQQASFREFLWVIAIAVVLVFTVMLATFGSYRQPLVILGAIPLALIGVALGLFITRTPFNVSSFMGLLLLVGIVVKNGILLIDAANRRREAGDDVIAALVAAGGMRLRPIVMTTLAAIGGLLPLALGLGAGAEMERPLAIAVIGGLSTATAFTLILIPVLYATFMGRAARRMSPAAASVALVALALLLPHAASAQANDDARFAQIDRRAAQSLAVNSSPNVRIASANVDAARASLAAARGTNGVSALAGYAEAPQGAAEGQIASRIMSYGAQVTLGDVAAYAPAIAQADATLRAAEADATAAERMERITVTGLYYSALKARAVLRARTDALALAQRLLDAANKRVAAGDAPRLDVVRAQVGVSRAEADLALARAAEGSATGALASEVQRPARTFALTMPDAQIATAIPEVPVAVAQALAHRADAASADRAVAAAEAAVNAARGSAIPPVTVGAGYNTGVDSGFRVAGPTFSATMAIPLGGSAAANVHLQRAQLTIAQARRDAVRRAIELEVASAVRTAAASLDVERATAQALDAAQRELAATTLGYDNGASTSLDVASARSTYEQAVLDALAARFDRLQAQALLDLEVGS